MPRNRVKKKGFVYLLKSQTNEMVYKYGATTLTPELRCKRVNIECARKGLDFQFKVISFAESNDCYKSENMVKWGILDSGLGAMSEKFIAPDGMTEEDVIRRFLEAL